MTSKEEATAKILNEVALGTVMVLHNDWKTLRRSIEGAVAGIDDHPKVKLPRAVGEEFDKTVAYLKANVTTAGTADFMIGKLFMGEGVKHHPELNRWFNGTSNAALILADAYRYGWDPEPEPKWYVKAPEGWEYPWAWKDEEDLSWVSAGARDKDETERFTQAELKKYHLDAGIFEKIPVEEDAK